MRITRLVEGKKLQVIKYRYVWFALSAVVIIVSVISLLTRGLNFGIDFTGGIELEVRCKPKTTLALIRSVLGEYGYAGAKIQSGEKGRFMIRTPELKPGEREKIVESLKKKAGVVEVLQINEVGPGWGAQVSKQAIIALVVFLFAILIYISIRFEFKMAICAILALFHDVLVTVGVYSLVGRQVNPATVIAVLTILGYSLYDTIVVFDRVKENADQLTRQSGITYSDMVNNSVNQTLTRSLNTSLTTLVPIVTILLFGGATLKDFAFALFVGVIAGTYSSIFFASTLLAIWKETEPKYRAYRERAMKRRTRAIPAGEAVQGGAKLKVVSGGKSIKPAGGVSPNARTIIKKPPQEPERVGEKTAFPIAGESSQKSAKVAQSTAGAKKASTKAAAKSRTKGPGSGKKKKKKR